MKLTMSPHSHNGGNIAVNEFAYILHQGQPFTPAGIDSVIFMCRGGKNRQCQVHLTLGPHSDKTKEEPRRWHWDGDLQEPTLEPSIGCEGRGIGCTWHGHITKGEIKP